MIPVTAVYTGELGCEVSHGPSGRTLDTDAPTDNQGRGLTFSPTDLVASAMASCILTTVAIVAERRGIDLRGMSCKVEKHMVADPVRRIGRLPAVLTIPGRHEPDIRKLIERTANSCPVHRSLHPDVDKPIEFVYPDDPAAS
ncbi:MAG: OsmC family protein [Planctomycetes bacterium]|nr:OsmC family protein [Planctomycetota bacterium]